MGLTEADWGVGGVREARRVLTSSSRTSAGVWEDKDPWRYFCWSGLLSQNRPETTGKCKTGCLLTGRWEMGKKKQRQVRMSTMMVIMFLSGVLICSDVTFDNRGFEACIKKMKHLTSKRCIGAWLVLREERPKLHSPDYHVTASVFASNEAHLSAVFFTL